MLAPAIGIVGELPVKIAGVEAGETRALRAVAFAVEAMTGETGRRRARVAAAERERLAGGPKAVDMGARVASRDGKEEEKGSGAHGAGTNAGAGWFPKRGARGSRMIGKRGVAGSMLLLLAACDPAPLAPPRADAAAIARGKAAAARHGCGACHDLPGIGWPKGTMGPPLHGFGRRGLIAGRLPNDLPRLAAFVRDAPSAVPGSAMPAVPMTRREARDIASWLQSLRD